MSAPRKNKARSTYTGKAPSPDPEGRTVREVNHAAARMRADKRRAEADARRREAEAPLAPWLRGDKSCLPMKPPGSRVE